ncbi:MAG: formate dehydrogenase accessory sulfurtransferase FdhD [Actinomycetota bacterium]|nr:MAG: molybdopterin-guanine dinucleotide biosynthesis protein [Actinomycetota bacterium]MDO8949535.1 formate dehydrogenase accessory sulfurtransferase FdhD [Actinomycetota bacterium]MDP3630315.1 formate dehydrogenase accessory sulfurtransferase FdhD [Actinomycetota bacterium]
MERLPVTAAVLAGGRSMRMGVDKTLLTVDGELLLTRVVEVVAGVCRKVVVVTNRPEALADTTLPTAVRVLQDEVAYQGPLGGLVTALSAAEDDWVLAVAADMPWLRPEVVRLLWDARGDAQVVMPVGEKGPEPLLALYHRDCLPVAQRVLESGRRRLVAMLSSVRVVEVPLAALRVADPDLVSLVNVNTPEDLSDVRDGTFPIVRNDAETDVRVSVIEVGTRRQRGMPSERAVTIDMNGVEIATVQASPDDLEEMAVGFLVSEGLLNDREAFLGTDVDSKRGMVFVCSDEPVPDDLVYRRRYITAGCGKGVTFASLGHTLGLEAVTSDVTVDSGELYDMMGQMARSSPAYRDTGGMHACALGRDGKVLLVREDVGRHNAVDKVLGRAWIDRVPIEGAVLLTTGRISYEMAVKAAKARVPVVVSRSAVTDLAAEVAQTVGVTLVGYARGGKLVVYTRPDRVSVAEEESE